jgi:DNA-directed RNA polymerase specialized sigma24 family protein
LAGRRKSLSRLAAHVRTFCKGVLRDYPMLKRELAALEEEKQAASGRTGDQALRLLRLEERWRQVRFYVQAVEDLLACLDEENRKLLELHFFAGYPPWRVAQELGMSVSNFYRYEKRILILLAHRLGL